jgi:hypothetical protein
MHGFLHAPEFGIKTDRPSRSSGAEIPGTLTEVTTTVTNIFLFYEKYLYLFLKTDAELVCDECRI